MICLHGTVSEQEGWPFRGVKPQHVVGLHKPATILPAFGTFMSQCGVIQGDTVYRVWNCEITGGCRDRKLAFQRRSAYASILLLGSRGDCSTSVDLIKATDPCHLSTSQPAARSAVLTDHLQKWNIARHASTHVMGANFYTMFIYDYSPAITLPHRKKETKINNLYLEVHLCN